MPRLSIIQREFIWTLAKTCNEINDSVTLHNEALTGFTAYLHCYLVKAFVRVQKLCCNNEISTASVLCESIFTKQY